MKEQIEQLEKQLKELKEYHLSAWQDYGSELCTGSMIDEERELERQIEILKNSQHE